MTVVFFNIQTPILSGQYTGIVKLGIFAVFSEKRVHRLGYIGPVKHLRYLTQ